MSFVYTIGLYFIRSHYFMRGSSEKANHEEREDEKWRPNPNANDNKSSSNKVMKELTLIKKIETKT